MRVTQLDIKNRLISMLLDHTIMGFILFIFEAPAMIIKIASLPHSKLPLPNTLFHFSLYDIIVFSLYFNKDLFLGQSIAKRILGFRIFNNNTGLPAGPLRCLVRNFTLLLWPIEVVVSLFNVERRIGDRIAGTRLGLDETGIQARPHRAAMILCIPLAACFTYVTLFYPMELLMNVIIKQIPEHRPWKNSGSPASLPDGYSR